MVARGRISRLLLSVLSLFLVLGCVGVASGCRGNAQAAGGDAALTVVGADSTEAFSLDDVKHLPSTEGYAGIKSSTGRITPPVSVKGVSLQDLFAKVGGLPDNMAVSITAKDGYEMTMSVEQLKAGDFITYDMVTGAEVKVSEPLTVIIAYEYDGKSIDPQGEGPLRLAIVSSKKDQVTDGHWSVKWVNKVQLKAIELDWTISLKGKLTEAMDKATFESGSADGCHGQSWTDADGNKWTGIPLYLLVGRVDDDLSHGGPAYNRDLAEAGYQVQIKASDGKSVEVSSATMYYKKELIVAYKLNDQPLPEEYWPLRLVGEGIDQASMIGKISEIQALVPTE
jgi:DMSO/TMAO reductase YedYZ molybdopterin-dependent catalytic subunit